MREISSAFQLLLLHLVTYQRRLSSGANNIGECLLECVTLHLNIENRIRVSTDATSARLADIHLPPLRRLCMIEYMGPLARRRRNETKHPVSLGSFGR